MRVIATISAIAFAASIADAQVPPPAAAPEPAAEEALPPLPAEPADRFEKLNRGIWGFNQAVDKVVLKPASSLYRFATPRPARRGIHAIFANLSEPWSFINNLLQGNAGRAMNNLGRFVINTTLGVGGLADHASDLGLKPANEDFGQTLGVWGVRSSAYLMLPLLGPSTVRDGIGTGVAFVADPYRVCLNQCVDLNFTQQAGITAVSLLDTRATLTESGADAFLESSLDPYAAARSAYLQRREQQIANTEDEDAGPAPASVDPTAAPDPADPPPEATAPTNSSEPQPAEPPVTDSTSEPKLSYLPLTIEG